MLFAVKEETAKIKGKIVSSFNLPSEEKKLLSEPFYKSITVRNCGSSSSRKLVILFVVIAAAVIVLELGVIVSVVCSIVLSKGCKPFM